MGVLNDILNSVVDETCEKVAQGAHEMASAIFNGSSFVMYPRGSHDNGPEQVPEGPVIEQPAVQEMEQGRSM